MILLSAEREKVDQLISAVTKSTEEWSRDNGVTLTVSCGAAGSSEYPGYGITELAKAADERMYEEKDRYYKSIGLERRRYARKQGQTESI